VNQVIAIIHEESGRYGIAFPDFPGCVSGGTSLEEAMRRGREALRAHVESMIEDGEAVPVPRAIDALKADPDFRADAEGAVAVALPLDMPGRAVRINISLDESLVAAVDQAAREAGMSRSAFIAAAARERLGR
jgi:predicted RNase H-like HicB family nuclease